MDVNAMESSRITLSRYVGSTRSKLLLLTSFLFLTVLITHTLRPDLSRLAASRVAHTWSSSGVYDLFHEEDEGETNIDGQVAGHPSTILEKTLIFLLSLRRGLERNLMSTKTLQSALPPETNRKI